MASSDKSWATEYLINPLHEPTPAEETGLNASFARQTPATIVQSPVSTQTTGTSVSTNPFRREKKPADVAPSTSSSKAGSSTTRTRAVSHGSNASNSPRREAFAAYAADSPPRRSADSPRTPPNAYHSSGSTGRPRRSSSLREKYPGDPSVHPLDQLTKEAKAANRAPHLRKKHIHGSDSIDKLDQASLLGAYHHEGPYDAASLARNNSWTNAPVAALAETTREALRATPRENIQDSIERHRPLDGVSSIPPGEKDRFGRTYHYREGAEEDVMRAVNAGGGAYKRYTDIDYLPEDLKGKGEPSYTIEKQLKDHKRNASAGQGNAVELVERPRRSVGEYDETRDGEETVAGADVPAQGASSSATTQNHTDGERRRSHRKEGSSGSFDGLKKRIGSLRRKDKGAAV